MIEKRIAFWFEQIFIYVIADEHVNIMDCIERNININSMKFLDCFVHSDYIQIQ